MSLLLEALKKAALEKRNRGSSEAETAPPTEQVAQDSDIVEAEQQKQGQESVDDNPLELDHSFIDAQLEDEEAGFEIEEQQEVGSQRPLDDSSEEDESEEDESKENKEESDPEFGTVAKAESQVTAEPDATESAVNSIEDELDEGSAESVGQKIQTPQVDERAEDLRREVEAEQARLAEIAHRKELEQNKAALNSLLGSGKAVEKSSMRRSRFLYAMLILTAAGSIISYYYYLSSRDIALNPIQLINQSGQSSKLALAEEDSVEITEIEIGNSVDTSDSIISNTEEVAVSVDRSQIALQEIELALGADASPAETEVGSEHKSLVSNELAEKDIIGSKLSDEAASINIPLESETVPPEPKAAAEQVIVHHRPAPARLSKAIQQGFGFYQQGQFDQAEIKYREALELSPHNRDALLGAAAVATQQQQWNQAMRYYQKRLSRVPKDEYAQSGLLSLASFSQANIEIQSELNSMLHEYPRSAHLHFLNGSLHAVAGDWNQAQKSFFEASHWNSNNADYVYNLAVSLDHLGQHQQALEFYRKALQLSSQYAFGFSLDAVRERLQILEVGDE